MGAGCECAHVSGSLRGKEQTLGVDIRRGRRFCEEDACLQATLAEEATHTVNYESEILFQLTELNFAFPETPWTINHGQAEP